MPRTRIVAAAAVFLVTTLGGAAAQATTDTAPGNPIPLLKILAQPDKAKAKSHRKRLGRRSAKTHVAAKTRALHRSAKARHAVPTPTDDAEPANVATAPYAAPSAALSAPAAAPVSSFAEPIPNELVIGGRTVQVTSANDFNEIDEAAGSQSVPATSTAMPGDIAAAQPPAETVAVARVQPDASPVGSASWIMQILAAFGGAFAAAAAAWFLIGSAPQRTYG